MSYTNLNYHLVFSTKQRRPLIGPDVMPRLREYVGGIIRNMGGQMLSANGVADHLHVATVLNQKFALMDVLKEIKGSSSEWIHQTFPAMRDFAWQEGYAAFTVSHSIVPAVMAYVASQVDHHKASTFEEEFVQFLNRHGIKFDPRYVFA
jgi:putative transposase